MHANDGRSKDAEAHELALEIAKLEAGVTRLRRETFFYPIVVGSGVALAVAAVARLFP